MICNKQVIGLKINPVIILYFFALKTGAVESFVIALSATF
jgi:hypothetical protein